jgi:hypothetical protein
VRHIEIYKERVFLNSPWRAGLFPIGSAALSSAVAVRENPNANKQMCSSVFIFKNGIELRDF